MVGGFAAARGHLGFFRVVLACALGTWIPAVALFTLGRRRGHWVRKRFRRARRFITPTLVLVRRSPWRAAFAVRFAFGVRIVLPLACGIARMRTSTFIVGTAVAALLWSGLFTGIGWVFGESAMLLLGRVFHEDWFAFALAATVALIFLLFVRRRSARRRLAAIALAAPHLHAHSRKGHAARTDASGRDSADGSSHDSSPGA